MRVCFAFHPSSSGAERAEELIERARDRAEVGVLRLDEDIDRVLSEDLREGAYDRLLVAGGDGTLSRVVGCLAPDFPEVDLALLPLGTGNDFARSLGIDPGDPDQALERALTATAQPVDVVRVVWDGVPSWYVNVANGGIGGRVVHEIDEDAKDRWGVLAYWAAGAGSVLSPEAFEIRVTLDGDETRRELSGLLVANGRFVGGGYPVAPQAMVNDGWLNVIAVPVLSPVELISEGIDVYLTRAAPDGVDEFRARSVEIEADPSVPFSIDGEPRDATHASFEIEPGAIRMVPGTGEAALEGTSTAAA